MKTFNELTNEQKSRAVSYSLVELKECIEMGLINYSKPITDQQLEYYAYAAAENAWYPSVEDKIVYLKS